MNTLSKFEIVRDIVRVYLRENGKYANLSELDSYNEHIIATGTSILCTKWKINSGGGFVQAFVNNDLYGAISRADCINIHALMFYSMLSHNNSAPTFK